MKSELRHINACLSEEQVRKVHQYMSERNIRHFSDGLREYIEHVETKPSDKAAVAIAA